MIFPCGHDRYSGKGKLCMDCDKLPQEERAKILKAIKNKERRKPNAVRGRPVTKTAEERKAKMDAWQKKNRVRRNKYMNDMVRKRNGVVKEKFVIELDGRFKCRSSEGGLKGDWVTFSLSHSYTSLGRANCAAKLKGEGVVMYRLETEAETLSHFKKYGLKEKVEV